MSTGTEAATQAGQGVAPARVRVAWGRWAWIVTALAAIVGSVLIAGVGGNMVNTAGWPNFTRFWSAMFRPALGADFLGLTVEAAATTLSFAVLGTLLSLGIGLVGAPLLARRTWRTDGRRSRLRRLGATSLRLGVRGFGVLPRGVNEIVWALVLAQVFGPAPLVAVLAIGLPFGAVTAAVFADTIDDADGRSFSHLRAHGAGRLSALVYGLGPIMRADLVSYGWYRFECAVRAAAILGIVGAGGLGYQIDLSFQSLRYHEMWTLIWALVLIAAAADAVSARLRHCQGPAAVRCGDLRVPTPATYRPPRLARTLQGATGALWARWAMGVSVAASALAATWWVDLDPSLLWSARRLELMGQLVGDMFPARLQPGGWGVIWEACVETLAMSVLAIVFSVGLGLGLAVFSVREPSGNRPAGHRLPRLAAASRRAALRLVALVARAVPSPVWVFLAVLVLYPGLWPGIVALGLYNAGVMARLFAESLEDMDPRPAAALVASGASGAQTFFYATLPAVAPRLAALSIYRWEVILRETIIVGVVGAGGLGRLIKDDLVARDFGALTTSLGALVLLTAIVSVVGARARAALR